MICKRYKIEKKDIKLFQFIIEGYEGLATVSTIDPAKALVQVLIMPDFSNEMRPILDHLQDIFFMKEIPLC